MVCSTRVRRKDVELKKNAGNKKKKNIIAAIIFCFSLPAGEDRRG